MLFAIKFTIISLGIIGLRRAVIKRPKIVCQLGVLTLLVSVFSGTWAPLISAQEDSINIGILQYVEHKALDDAREGFMEELKASEYGDRIKFDVQNASGDNSSLQSIGEKLARDNDILYALATPAVMSLAAIEREKPVFFAAVNDPVQIGVVNSLEQPGGNVTGTSDRPPIDQQIDFLQRNFPQVKKVGIIYDSGELNSQIQVEEAKELFQKAGIDVAESSVTSTNDIQQVLAPLLSEVELLFLVKDNTIDSSIKLVGDMAIEAGIPMLGSSEPTTLENGMVTISKSYVDFGKQTARMVIRMLDERLSPKDLPVELGEDFKLVVNEANAEKLKFDWKNLK